jgi:LemA protein
MNSRIKSLLIGLAVVIALLLLSVVTVNGVQNRAIEFGEQINTASSDIKVQEKRRVDLLGNLVDCVKEYDEHEYNTLKDVVEARSTNDGDISEITTMINATAEAYPELQSSDNYKQLMNELSTTENMIAEYRSNYNKQVKSYNRYVRKFPNVQFLNMLGYETIDCDYLDYNAPVDAEQDLFED